MQDFIHKKIVLGICGSISAYKSALLVRELTRLGAVVRVVMTASATAFITPMTLQALSGHDVRTDLFDSQAESAMGHIELARWADILLIAPASANCLANMANGLANDLLSTLYLVAECPVLICPAMNRCMWMHPATQDNYERLVRRGVVVVGPAEGLQACGESGYGRMSEVEDIIAAMRLFSVSQRLRGHHVLITAGPTHEPIDPVRYISNRSSGKMGYALAQAALMAGAQVTLVTGPTSLPVPIGATVCRVETAQAMFDAVMTHLQSGMIFIGAAAVGDYGVDNPAAHKLKKKDFLKRTLTLSLNPDILSAVSASAKAAFVVGFAAETSNVLSYAADKLRDKSLDMLVANQVGVGLGFDVDDNQVTVLTCDESIDLEKTNKIRLAGLLIALIADRL